MGDEHRSRLSAREKHLPGGATLGSTATIVQFSSAFCQPCRATRRVIASVVEELASAVPGIAVIDVDADESLDLARQWTIESTPTVVFLDSHGKEAYRATGQPRRIDVIAALGRVIPEGLIEGAGDGHAGTGSQ